MSVNQQLAEELQKPVTKKIQKIKVYPRFEDNIWAADLAEKGSLSSKNKSFNYLLSAIYRYFLQNIHGLNLWKIKQVKQFWMLLSK